MSVFDLSGTQLLIIGVISVLVGITKTGVPGVGIFVVPFMAQAFPAKESVGALLPLLIVGDIFAVVYYQRHTQVKELFKLIPGVAIGMAVGWLVLSRLENETMRPVLGGLVLLLLGIELLRRARAAKSLPQRKWFGFLVGIAAGCATTLGNAAGPIMSIYLVMMALDKRQLLGTMAWFFFIVNCSKIPIFIQQEMLAWHNLQIALCFAVLVVIGALTGKRLQQFFNQRWFDRTVLGLAALSAIWLFVG